MPLQVFALICDAENPQVFTVEFIRGQIRKFSSTERFINLTSVFSSWPFGCLFNGTWLHVLKSFLHIVYLCRVCRDSLLASLLDGVRASGNRDVCVKMAPTQRGQRWGLLSMPVDEEVESLHLKFLAAPPSKSKTFCHMTVMDSDFPQYFQARLLPFSQPCPQFSVCKTGSSAL